MCLDYVKSQRTKIYKQVMAEAKKKGYLRVYKECAYKATGWHPVHRESWKKGIRAAKNCDNWSGGYYGFLTKEGAESYNLYNHIKMCFAKPEWLKELGGYNQGGIAARFTHLAFPDWNKGKMTVKEFKQMCKKYKGKEYVK